MTGRPGVPPGTASMERLCRTVPRGGGLKMVEWSGCPLYPSDPPDDYSKDPCTWYWYKDRDDIPARHWERHGAVKGTKGQRLKERFPEREGMDE